MMIRTRFGIRQFLHFCAVVFCIILVSTVNLILLKLAAQSDSSAVSFLYGFISCVACLVFVISIVMINDYYDSEERKD
jgi:bacteriorhodopsin